jgi:hypothetical protein
MQHTRFWRVIAVVAVFGLFYVGHGLHEQQHAMPWEQAAQGATLHPQYSPWVDGLAPVAVTQSADGKTIFFWGKSSDAKVMNPTQKLQVWGAATGGN